MSTQGVELDFTWAPMENLTLFGGIASIDAEIDKFNRPDPTATHCSARSGLPVPFAPELQYSLMAHYALPLDNMDILIHGSLVHTD